MKEQVKCCREPCTSNLRLFISGCCLLFMKPTFHFFFFFSQLPLTLSRVTGRRLDYTIFSLDIGVTDATKYRRFFAVTSTTRSTLLLAVCFNTVFPPHRHPAHPVSVSIRHISDQSSVVISFETDMHIHRKYNKIPEAHTRYTHACGVRVVFLRWGSWHFQVTSSLLQSIMNLCPLHIMSIFSFVSKRSGRRMPPAERSGL